jgi:hypothetical protein
MSDAKVPEVKVDSLSGGNVEVAAPTQAAPVVAATDALQGGAAQEGVPAPLEGGKHRRHRRRSVKSAVMAMLEGATKSRRRRRSKRHGSKHRRSRRKHRRSRSRSRSRSSSRK